jgi:peptidoglycan/LPS O-acetylase OafA/YrhL
MAIRLADVADSRDNNFDVLRLFAAGLVLVSHSFPLSGRHEPLAPHTLGTVGVEIFFATSGFLVTKSWLRDPSFRRYIGKRVRRIFPGLICAVLVTAFVVGPTYSAGSPAAFLASGAPLDYALSNIFLFPHYVLSTVFAANPDHVANGSLWTLPIEMRAYILLALLGIALLRRGAVGVLAVLLFGMLLAVTLSNGVRSPAGLLLGLFVSGGALYVVRASVVLRFDVAGVLLALWLAAFTTPFATPAGMVALPYLIACFAYRTPRGLRRLVAKGDVSYGVYLYAFPITQALVATFGRLPPVFLALIAAPLVWLVALLSWKLVEQPMLHRRHRRTGLGRDVSPSPA